MGNIDYEAIYARNKHGWYDMTEDPQKFEALLAGHYSDSNHFVYELLQNAEDAFDIQTGIYASKVVIEYYKDRLVFYHNGKPFDEADVRGVSSMLMGTKDRDDAQTIGRFGMGFKSVFKYTYQPEIYSDSEAFKITNYLLPVEIQEGWNYEEEKKAITCKLGEGRYYKPFESDEHLTKIIIPFLKYGKNGDLKSVSGEDVLKKLNELDGRILLFLSHIRSLYWINKENGYYAKISLKRDKEDKRLVTCRIEGTAYGKKEEITRYLKYKRTFNHSEMENAEISVAYKLNSRADNINEINNGSPICVYFPTKDDTDLPFLIHGSFETAVSREKLMAPSDFNDELFDALGNLIADSLVDLANRTLITQMFIRKTILVAFEDEEENDTIPGLKEKITRKFKDKGLLPDRSGNYRRPEELLIPVPFRIGDFSDRPLVGKALEGKFFVAFNNERETKFTEYYNWLAYDLDIELYGLSDFAEDLKVLAENDAPISGDRFKALTDLYEFLSDNRISIYDTGLSYSRSGPYESQIRSDLREGWSLLKQAPIILNRLNMIVPAEVDGKPAIYLAASSEYKSVKQSALVLKSIADKYKILLIDGFDIQEFNNFQFVKEKVIKKYIDIDDKLAFDDSEDFTEEYIEDLNQIFSLIDEGGDISEVREMLEDACIIKVNPVSKDENASFARPDTCYIPVSDEGIDLNVYYHEIPLYGPDEYVSDDENYLYDFELYAIDKDFYERNGISISKLSKLGLNTSPVDDGIRSMHGTGDGYWVALGEFCPKIDINGLTDNLNYIESYPDDELAHKKSVEILKLLLQISGKLSGKRRRRQRNPYDGETEEVFLLSYYIKKNKWLFNKDMKACSPTDMSKYDLNPALYEGIQLFNKSAFAVLGFVESDVDEAEETFQRAKRLSTREKKLLYRQLRRELGLSDDDTFSDATGSSDDNDMYFDINTWQDTEFPVKNVTNIEYLHRHVQEQFYCADPTTYRKVLRQIRISKNAGADRAYAIGMYTNSNNVHICQICKKPIVYIDVVQISNFGIEMPQLNLCLCKECSARYKAIREGNRDDFKEKMKKAFMSFDISEVDDDYKLEINQDTIIHFTQTHVAEIQEILRLLAEYGTPSEIEGDEDVSGPLLHPRRSSEQKEAGLKNKLKDVSYVNQNVGVGKIKTVAPDSCEVATSGRFISYKKKFGNYDIFVDDLDPDNNLLHKALEGHRVGDTIIFNGNRYEIIGL